MLIVEILIFKLFTINTFSTCPILPWEGSTLIINFLIIQWNKHPLKWRGFPVVCPMPFSPVHNAQKFSAVLGTISTNNTKTIQPTCSPPMSMSKKTRGLLGLESLALEDGYDMLTFRCIWKQVWSTSWPPGSWNSKAALSAKTPLLASYPSPSINSFQSDCLDKLTIPCQDFNRCALVLGQVRWLLCPFILLIYKIG